MSEYVDGGLGFRAELNIDDFNISADAMERRMKKVSNAAVYESERMDQSLLSFAQNGAKYIATYLIGNGLSNLLNSIVQVRGQFQQLDIAFETMLGSATKSNALMNQLLETAAKTPFDLTGIASGAKQLLAYGTAADKVNETLVRLGNIASGLSIPLNDIVYLYGTTQVQGRLYAQDVRQFTTRGIPLVRELAEMYGKNTEEITAMVSAGKIGFADVEKVILKMTNSGGQFFNLMEKQSKSLTGMIANFGDAWQVAQNKFGEDNQDLFAAGIEGATYMVEHLDDILRILKAIAIAYGTYKAAIIANTIVTKGYTGIALIDNTVRQAKIALMKAEENLSGRATAKIAAMTAAEKDHTASLEAQLSAEERSNVVRSLRIATIQSMLTAQQQEYLSNLNLTTSSRGYEAAAMSVLSVDQQQSLNKLDLSSKSAIYRAAIEKEVLAKKQNTAASLEAMRSEVKEAHAKIELAKQSVVTTSQATESARYEVYWAKQSGQAKRIATAEERLLAAQENQSIARKAALSAQSDFYTKKKALETAATKSGTVATATDTIATNAQIVKKSLLSTVTTGLIVKMKALWATMLANPLTAIISLVGMAISAFTLFGKKNKEAGDAMGEFQESTKSEIDYLNVLVSVLKNTEAGTKSHKDALDKVNKKLEEYNKELLTESSTVEQLQARYKELTEAINQSAAARVKARYIENIQQNQTSVQEDAKSSLIKGGSRLKRFVTNESNFDSKGYWESVSSIQKMNEAIYDQIEIMALESADNLKNLTGSAYTEGFSQTLERISKAVQAASNASDEDMDAFQGKLSTYLSKVVKSEQEANQKTKELTSSIEAFAGAIDGKPSVAESVDYVKTSFSDLDKMVKDTQSEIDAINAKTVKVDTDNKKLDELLQKLGTIKSAITDKQTNLNTESSINARIKELKEERENVEINGIKYKDLTNQINTLSKKIPNNSKNDGEDAIKKREELAEKQLQVDIKLEQARIDVMEEGYEKRKAVLNLQHKRNLAEIDKEEKELQKVRREAGKSGLSDKEQSAFADRRKLEDQSYSKEQNKLFDGEIDYKKKQYELYFRWVKNMGEDFANTQFSSLLKGGASYKDYVEKQIQELTNKKNAGSLSEGEGNHLIALNIQYDEITGAKTAMDTFKESMSQAINRATTLAEKIQAIADAKEKLDNGKSGLVGADEKAEASLFVSEQEKSNDKEIQERLLKDFRTFEQNKADIVEEYKLLRLQKQVEGNQILLDMINKGEADALSAINAKQLKQSADWQNLFVNLDYLSASEIERILTNIQAKIDDTDLKLNPVDYNALVESLNDAKAKLIAANPFKVLGQSFSEYIKKLKEVKDAQDENLSDKEIQKLEVAANMALQNTISSIASINDMVQSVGSSMSGIADSFGGDKLSQDINNITDLMGATAQAGTGVAKIISGDIVGGVKDLATGLANAVQIFNKMHDQKKEKQIQQLQKNVDALAKSYKQLGDEIERAYSVDKSDLIEKQNKSLEEQNKAMRKQIEAEKSKKKTDKDKIKEWQDQIAENEKEIAENRKYNIIEAIIGTDIKSAIDEFAEAYADAWSKGETAAGKSADVVKNLIKNSIIDMLKSRLKPEVEAFMTFLADALKDGVISDAEDRMIEDWEKRLEAKADAELKGKERWLRDPDDDNSDDPLTGAIRGMSEETGSLVAGKLNAVVINQGDQLDTLRQSLLYQQEIAANTRYNRYLESIDARLNRIENKENSLLSQGLE
ncbi:MAG TPA: phage tail tape measure protein [Porphyromonadaceae bacterium]|nr:phage tail tape measure protein [Porphyromonadaceae bacterium]